MPELVTDCPRCGSLKITFDLTQDTLVKVEAQWKRWYETFCVCRHCKRATVFVLSQNNFGDNAILDKNGPAKISRLVNDYMSINGYINLKDIAHTQPPEHLPEGIKAAFEEGAKCLAIDCYNATGTMFRLCVDLATRSKLPKKDVPSLNAKIRRDLGLRLPWLFDNDYLPDALRELSICVKEDGNDGAHAGSLKKDDAYDLLDFTVALLERIYTEPERIRIAKERRDSRRGTKKQ
ncbi:MAG: DUF4145 domain-containing protein [Syntrophales bacterium]|nr:DUF4145 domain-containing protein [Syntrophales bacterium]